MYRSFIKAKPIWGQNLSNEYNQFLGFHRTIDVKHAQNITILIAARNYYRLYINGTMIASGPARTAVHYCRVDEITLFLNGKTELAVEVAAYSTPERYCNDCTMESGAFIMEIIDSGGCVLAATGDSRWRYQELLYRDSFVETMSHCREIIEVYHLSSQSFGWKQGLGQWKYPMNINEEIHYLKRRSPYPTYRSIPFRKLFDICDVMQTDSEETDINIELVRRFNPQWYKLIPGENCFLQELLSEKDVPFSGSYKKYAVASSMLWEVGLQPGKYPSAFILEIEKSEVGFLDFTVNVEKNCIIDLINTDHLESNGSVKSNSYVTRYYLSPGNYHLTTFAPKLTKYIKMIFRTEGPVLFSSPQLLDYSYPDTNECLFECSDEDLNRIYHAARRTLRLNTLDIFMDCPQRERGGWLCDSYFSAFSAWQLFGDLSVERDFLENFMLTDPDRMWHAFFPEVYPGSKADPSDPGIRTWSFWLAAELADYYKRSGDREFIEQCRERVSCFMEGMLALRGKSGLLEGMVCSFIDWSISNRSFCLEPISVPSNCLAVNIMEEMSSLYQRPDWKKAADEIRGIIDHMDNSMDIFSSRGDSAQYADGILKRGECATESGIALELWSGFHSNDKAYIQNFIETMGPCPQSPADPNIGKANLFIGLMIRFDLLARLGDTETLIRDWKALYLPQLSAGTGTLFENCTDMSGCHGFNGAVGALMTNKILGLGQPLQSTKTVIIEPHPSKLKWANGSAKCQDGMILFHWSADYTEHILNMVLSMPEGWNYELHIPFELNGWTLLLNGYAVSPAILTK